MEETNVTNQIKGSFKDVASEEHMESIKAGSFVKHFKRELMLKAGLIDEMSLMNIYEVIDTNVLNTTTDKREVSYRALYPPFRTFTRDYDDFFGFVDKPGVKQVFKLELADEEVARIAATLEAKRAALKCLLDNGCV